MLRSERGVEPQAWQIELLISLLAHVPRLPVPLIDTIDGFKPAGYSWNGQIFLFDE